MREHLENKHKREVDENMLDNLPICGAGRIKGLKRACHKCDFTTTYLRTIKVHLLSKHNIDASDQMLQETIIKGATQIKPFRKCNKPQPEFLAILQRIDQPNEKDNEKLINDKKFRVKCRECRKEGRFDNMMKHVSVLHQEMLKIEILKIAENSKEGKT